MTGNLSTRPESAFAQPAGLAALRACPSFHEACARMLYLVENRRSLGLVVGPAGCGKSDLLELVHQAIPGQGVVLDMATLDAASFGWKLAAELGLAPRADQPAACTWQRVEDHLHGQSRSGQPLTLLLSRLDLADPGSLRCLERLMGTAVGSGHITVLAAGQDPLPLELRDLMQRYADMRIELGPLCIEELRLYLEHLTGFYQLASFDEGAIDGLHRLTGGLLRDVRRCALLALLAAESQQQPVVSEEMIVSIEDELPNGARTIPSAELLYS